LKPLAPSASTLSARDVVEQLVDEARESRRISEPASSR
jgi:hypothetical protein